MPVWQAVNGVAVAGDRGRQFGETFAANGLDEAGLAKGITGQGDGYGSSGR